MYPEVIYRQGRIYTLDSRRPQADALAVWQGRVVAVASDAEIGPPAGPGTAVVDLEGATVLPGFHDSHCHVLAFGLSLVEVNVRQATSVADVVAAVASRVRQTPPGGWIRGGGYNDHQLAEHRHPNRYDLDPVSPHHPVWLYHVSGHMGVANSLALQVARITRDTQDPPGGRIARDESAEPTGLLLETAQDLVKRVLPPYTVDELKPALAAAGRQMAAEGITAAQDAWAGWIAPEEFRAYQEATEEGLLPQRVWLLVDIERIPVRDGRLEFAFGLHTGFGSERLRLGAVKIFVDGSLIGGSAALRQPYAHPPGSLGVLVKDPDTLTELVRLVHSGGWQVAMHAIGDRAVEVALDAIERVMGSEAFRFRPRIEHCGLVSPDLLQRLHRVRPVVVTQPRFLYELAEGYRWALGQERLRWLLPVASLRGLPLALSSDRPVVDGAPLKGIHAAVTRRTQAGWLLAPEEAISVEEAVQAYTTAGAYAAFAEAELGSLAPGKWADFVALDRDPFQVDPEELPHIQVLRTVVGGRTVHQAA